MPKEYHTWLSELEGTIDDSNTWVGQSLNVYAGKFTDLQKRMMFADIIEPQWETYPDTWIKLFCLVEIDYSSKRDVLGEDMYLEYVSENSLAFVERLRLKVKGGWKPE